MFDAGDEKCAAAWTVLSTVTATPPVRGPVYTKGIKPFVLFYSNVYNRLTKGVPLHLIQSSKDS